MSAKNSKEVLKIAESTNDLATLAHEITGCRACPRLVNWCETVAHEKKRAYFNEQYWGRPVPGFGSTEPKVIFLGLAPGAHGANRTGRVFTGDRSGDFLFASLHRTGFASQSTSTDLLDGLMLWDSRILTAVRCAPPGNKPTPTEESSCRPWVRREIELTTAKIFLAFGSFAWSALWSVLREIAPESMPARRVPFGHGVRAEAGPYTLLATYHPSQQNTFTGKLTEVMLDEVLAVARTLADGVADQ